MHNPVVDFFTSAALLIPLGIVALIAIGVVALFVITSR